MPHKILFFILILFSVVEAQATEIYAVVLNNCKTHTGLIIEADRDGIDLMDLQGRPQRLDRTEIKSLTIFNTIENPIGQIQLDGKNLDRLREISIDSQDQPYITGWPVRFVEDLVIFYDVNGKTFVLNFDRMTRVRKISKSIGETLNPKASSINLEMTESLGQCSTPSPGSGPLIRPTRIISDKIQLSEFVTGFVTGFENMESFEERTFLYALPYLYERTTRMGFLSSDSVYEQLKLTGFYFQWARGRPYRFQSSYKVGIFPMRYAPTSENIFGAVTDLKSHLFHASFAGNLSALPAGSSYYTRVKDLFVRDTSSPAERSHFAPGFNYMALMGLDYAQWSGSFGTYFPNFAMIADSNFREVLSPKVQPIFRVMFTVPKFQAMILFSRGELRKDSGVTDRDLSIDSTQSVIGVINSFNLKYDYINSDITYRFNDEFSGGVQFILVKGTYRETTFSSQNNRFEFDHTTLVANLRHQFGDYVSLTANVKSYAQKQNFNFAGQVREEPLSATILGGVFEFIF